MSKKKNIIIYIIIALLIISGGVGYYYTQRTAPATPEDGGVTPEEIIPKEIEIPCIIFDQEYCKKGEAVYDKEGKFIGLGFSLPDKTKIYAPFGGFMDYPVGSEIYPNALYFGISIQEKPPLRFFDIFGAVKPVIEDFQRLVSKGEIVAAIDKSKKEKNVIPVIAPDGEKTYDVILEFMRYDPYINSSDYDFERFKQFFPHISYP